VGRCLPNIYRIQEVRLRSVHDADMKSRTHFNHRIEMLDDAGEILEHLAGVENWTLAKATWQAAVS
jgi:hypothetical protein